MYSDKIKNCHVCHLMESFIRQNDVSIVSSNLVIEKGLFRKFKMWAYFSINNKNYVLKWLTNSFLIKLLKAG